MRMALKFWSFWPYLASTEITGMYCHTQQYLKFYVHMHCLQGPHIKGENDWDCTQSFTPSVSYPHWCRPLW